MANGKEGVVEMGDEGLVRRGWPVRYWVGAGLVIVLAAAFAPCLWDLLRLAKRDDLYSHLPLIPAICAYLLITERGRCSGRFSSSFALAGVFAALGASFVAAGLTMGAGGEAVPLHDALFWPIAGLVMFCYATAAACFGARTMRTYWFEGLFLLFFIPMPTALVEAVVSFLTAVSADAVAALLTLLGVTYFRDGQVFHLAGLTVEVAPECSGIRSTLVLLITGLLAARLFLRRPWKQAVLVLAVIPLGILRNAIRIVTISLLTIHVDQGVIHGPIHTRGGPLFFALSLAVLFGLLFLLRAIGTEKDVSRGEAA